MEIPAYPKTEQAFSEEMLKKLSYFLILSLVQTFVSHLHDDNHHTFPKMASSLFNIAKLFIKDNSTQPSSHLNMFGRHLSLILVLESGVSYSEFVQNGRIQRAATLLKTTDLSMKDISEESSTYRFLFF